MILVLDDDPARHRAFTQGLVGAHVKHTTTAAEAIRALERFIPSTLFLDYDLDQHGRTTADAGTGGDVADWLRGRASRYPGMRILVHSLNWAHGPRITCELCRHGFDALRRPGAWDDPSILDEAVSRDRAA